MSYSVYLMLPVLLDLYDDIPFPPGYHHLAWLQAGASAVFVVVLLTCAAMTYHLVEAPMQRLARRVIARLDATDSIAPLLTARVRSWRAYIQSAYRGQASSVSTTSGVLSASVVADSVKRPR